MQPPRSFRCWPALFTLLAACGVAAEPPAAPWTESRRLEVARPSGQADFLLSFESGRFTWEARPPLFRCLDGSAPTVAKTWRVGPQVEELRCAPEGGGLHLAGGAGKAENEPLWRVPLELSSGPYRFTRRVVGDSRSGIVLSDLEVIMPATGKILVLGPRDEIASEGRSVPRYNVVGATLFAADAFYRFEAESTVLGTEGGLFRLRLPPGPVREDLLPVDAGLFGRYWRAEDFEIDPSGRFLAIAEQWSARGPAAVRFTVLDLQKRRIVSQAEFGKGEYCQEPRLELGPGGELGFTYWNVSRGQQLVVEHQLLPVE